MILFSLTAGLHALELYMRRSAVLQARRPTVRELVHVLPADNGAAGLDAPLSFDISRPTLLPAAAVREAALDRAQGPVIVSGGRVALVPADLASPQESLLYRDLLEYIDAVERDRSLRVELELLDRPAADDYDGGLRKHFELRELGDVTEVGYPTVSGRPRSFRMAMHRMDPSSPAAVAASPVPEPAAAAVRGPAADPPRELALRSGERIRIRFVRDAVTVTLPGRALRAGSTGEIVPVRPFDSEQSYQGLVTGKREVRVDLP